MHESIESHADQACYCTAGDHSSSVSQTSFSNVTGFCVVADQKISKLMFFNNVFSIIVFAWVYILSDYTGAQVVWGSSSRKCFYRRFIFCILITFFTYFYFTSGKISLNT